MSRTVRLDENVNVSTSMHIWSCPTCGILYGVPVAFANECREDGKRYYCPNGHSLGWSETEADKQRKRADRAERDAANAIARANREHIRAESMERSRRAVKGQLTKTKKRIAGGACPCCNRTFANLGRHMQSRHPTYVNPAGEEES